MELHEVAVQSALHLFCEALLHSATTNACVYMCRDRLPQKCFKVLIVGCETNHGRSGRHNHEVNTHTALTVDPVSFISLKEEVGK